MPIYEYRCEQCGHELEAMQRMADAALTDCPACREPALKKMISAAAFRLKGGGWYETDFKSGSKKNLHETGGDKPASGDAKPASSDAKPASSEAKPASGKAKQAAATPRASGSSPAASS